MVTLRVLGDATLPAFRVTEALGVAPTEVFEVGDPVSRSSSRLHSHSAWLLSNAASPEDGTELAEALHRVIDRVEPVAASLWALERAGYEVDWFCYVGSHAAEHAAVLDRRTIERLVALPGELWLDIYSDLDGEE